MAVYTHLTNEQIIELLKQYYNDFELIEPKPISEGVSNSNYLITVRIKDYENDY